MKKLLLISIGVVVVVWVIMYLTKEQAVAPETTIDQTQTEQQPPKNTVTLAENTGGKTATVAHASLTKSGFVVIYRTDAKGTTTVAGHSPLLAEGEHADVVITLDADVKKDAILVAVLYGDNGDGTFDARRGDLPLTAGTALATDSDVVDVPQAEENAQHTGQAIIQLETALKAAERTMETGMVPDKENVAAVTVRASNFSFSPASITVTEGQTVRVTFINDDGFHDFVVDEFAGAKTKQIKGGESETIEFVAGKKGTFAYYCSVGQHRAMGMEGKLIVE